MSAHTLLAEYLWLDGASPTQRLRSKTRILQVAGAELPAPDSLPSWSFDGSSTNQADGADSDLILEPVRVVRDPIRGGANILVLCEVFQADGRPHATNQRAELRALCAANGGAFDPYVGFEQEYTLLSAGRPLGFPEDGFPAPQGPYYCGVGADAVYGREIVETHARACLEAGLLLFGVNAEVMPGQWEFQMGYRGFEGEGGDPLEVSDHVWIARYLLERIAAESDVVVSYDNKPMQGDWNGAGMHTNWSTNATRDPEGGLDAIWTAVGRLKQRHERHIARYGAGLEKRLTGLHETCDINQFRHGVADRGASVRVPRQVREAGHGYLEDRRPGANSNPYEVCSELMRSVCTDEDEFRGLLELPAAQVA